MHVHWQDRHLERRDVIRPDDSAFVIVLLDSGSNNARYANAVAAHGQNLVTAIFALNGSVHCARVLIAQLEDVAYFDTAFDHQGTLAVRAWIACDHVTDVSHFRRRHVTIPVDAEVVFTVDVCARSEVAHRRNGAVNDHRNRHVHRTQRTRTCIHHGADLRFRCEGQRAGNLRQLLGFHFVQLVIASYQQGNQWISATFSRFHQQGFHGFFDRQSKLLNQLGDSFRVWRINQRHLLRCRAAWFFRCQRFCKFDVRGVIRGVREDHIVFAALRQNLEFMGGATAD